jgi:zinc transport system substrate-binding protein
MNIRRVRKVLRAAAFGTTALLLAHPALAAPKVVASIKPLHSLVAGVMAGVGEPSLIVKGAASPHTYAMRPADAKALSEADVVFWAGEGLENFLEKPLSALAGKARVVTLMAEPGLRLLPTREGGLWEESGETHDHGAEAHDEHEHEHGAYDGHIWLDPQNAKFIADRAVAVLSESDPANAAGYAANGRKLGARLDTLDGELRGRLDPIRSRPYVVFHDAYHYFEDRYGLNAVGAITVSPDRRPSARRLSEIRAHIRKADAACVFAEPQFEPTLVRTVVEGTGAGTGVLDPEGANLPDGPDLYFNLMRANAEALAACLGRR